MHQNKNTYIALSLDRIERWILVALVLLATLIRLNLWRQNPLMDPDGVIAVRAARYFEAGHFNEALSTPIEPGYPLLLLLFHWIFGDWVLAGRLLSLFAGLIAIFPFYLLSRYFFGRQAAIIASIFFIQVPLLNLHGYLLFRDSAFLLFFLSSYVYFYKAMNGNYRHLLAGVFFSILSAFLRVEGFFLNFWMGLVLALEARRNLLLRRMAIQFGSILVIFTLIVILAGFIHKEEDVFPFNRLDFLGNNFSSLFNLESYRNNHMNILHEQLKLYENQQTANFENNFWEITRSHVNYIYLMGLISSLVRTTPPILFVLAIIGLFRARKSSSGVLPFLICPVAGYAAVDYAFLLNNNFFDHRYFLPLLISLYPATGLGLLSLTEWMNKWLSGEKNHKIVLLLLIALVSLILARQNLEPRIKREAQELEYSAGKWVNEHTHLGANILTNSRLVEYYGERPIVDVAYLAPEYMKNTVRGKSPDYAVLVFSRTTTEKEKAWLQTLDEEGYQKVSFSSTEGNKNRRIHIFKKGVANK